ncbi:hypothetical protein BS47DRAFT_1296108 [Hydnum rufescens UP504]|uniref:Phospholipid/glycerol acyltransferase domain-containing protein n=1 Tax=Hydnum rufescens UP504 TaxID=1448309 RepID=A0A9P6AX10_9AGAM|nr:hypothetical protein BS47DRAFT_1296108 [Hydnum rufescens UP504]
MVGAILPVLVTQLFAPTSFVLTYEGLDSADSILERDAEGQIVRINVPQQLVIMANHQIYADWMYLWCLTYYMHAHDQVTIILKKSLKHIPFIGWGMQFYRFIFLARSWSADRIYLGKHLVSIAQRAQRAGQAFALLIFPEGTLVSQDTRPLSKKYADKISIADMEHTLLPRSTGLHFILRTLGPAIPSLQVLDVTIGYAGVPAKGYGQDHYTLRSIFFQGVPPPKIHVHLRLYPVSLIPIGNTSGKNTVGHGAEASPEEAAKFDSWLRERWIEKDRLMDGFYRDGKFSPPAGPATSVEIPVRLLNRWEALDAYAWFAPVIAGYLLRFAGGWVMAKFASGT